MDELLELTQGCRTVLQYKEKFTKLAHFTPLIVGDDETKVKNFIGDLGMLSTHG